MEKSGYLQVNARDFWRGLGITLLTTLLTTVSSLAVGVEFFSRQTILIICATMISTMSSYLAANLLTNSKGGFLEHENNVAR